MKEEFEMYLVMMTSNKLFIGNIIIIIGIRSEVYYDKLVLLIYNIQTDDDFFQMKIGSVAQTIYVHFTNL